MALRSPSLGNNSPSRPRSKARSTQATISARAIWTALSGDAWTPTFGDPTAVVPTTVLVIPVAWPLSELTGRNSTGGVLGALGPTVIGRLGWILDANPLEKHSSTYHKETGRTKHSRCIPIRPCAHPYPEQWFPSCAVRGERPDRVQLVPLS